MKDKFLKLMVFMLVPVFVLSITGNFGIVRYGLEKIQPSFSVNLYYLILGKDKLNSTPTNDKIKIAEKTAIAHAGGGFDGLQYRNDMPSLNTNSKHYRFIEIDFLYTSDNRLVCLHDWAGSIKKIWGGKTTKVLTYKEFMALAGENACTLARLNKFLKENPNVFLVSDVKSDGNIKALAKIYIALTEVTHQIIPQIYSPYEFFDVRDLGFKNIILTLYKSGLTNSSLNEHLNYLDLFAVTMPTRRASSELIKDLKNHRPLKIFTHTTNECSEAYRLFSIGVDGIYTDWLHQKFINNDLASCKLNQLPN